MSEGRKVEVEALFKLVQSRYGGRLSAYELEEVRKGVEAIVEAVESMRSVKLSNSDEPDFTFKPLEKD